jgi:hypothetical protein
VRDAACPLSTRKGRGGRHVARRAEVVDQLVQLLRAARGSRRRTRAGARGSDAREVEAQNLFGPRRRHKNDPAAAQGAQGLLGGLGRALPIACRPRAPRGSVALRAAVLRGARYPPVHLLGVHRRVSAGACPPTVYQARLRGRRLATTRARGGTGGAAASRERGRGRGAGAAPGGYGRASM